MKGLGTGAIVAAALALSACSRSSSEAEHVPLVQTVVVGREAASAAGLAGSVAARIESDLAFRVPGKLVQRAVEAGAAVRRGQLIARIDPTDYALASAAAQAEVAQAQAQNRRTQDDLRRFVPLAQRGFVSGRDLDAARAEADSASARLRAAEANARALGNQRGYAALVADSDGVVMSVVAEPGQYVTAGQPVVRLARHGPRDLVVAIPEGMQSAARAAATVTIYGEGQPRAATLHSLAAAADPATRTYLARYEIAGATGVPLGATGTVRLASGPAARLTVPLGALHDDGHGPGVWVIGPDSRVRFRPVRVAALGDETAELAGGLRPGERIVALGAQLLKQNQTVRVAGNGSAR